MKNILKRFLKRASIAWPILFVLIFACMGIVMGHSLSTALEPSNYSHYADKLAAMAHPETAEDAEKSSAGILMDSVMSDAVIGETAHKNEIEYCVNRVMIDRQGNVLLDGVIGAVLSERNDGATDLNNHKQGFIVGYFSADDILDQSKAAELADLLVQHKNAAVSIDEYRLKGMQYYPTKLSVWEGNEKIAVYECDTDRSEAAAGELWVSDPHRIFQAPMNSRIQGKNALTAWCEANMNTVFSDKERVSESGMFKGIEKYSFVNNGEIALVSRAYLDGTYLCKVMAEAAVLIAMGFAFILSLIIGIAGWMIKKKRKPE